MSRDVPDAPRRTSVVVGLFGCGVIVIVVVVVVVVIMVVVVILTNTNKAERLLGRHTAIRRSKLS